MAVNSNSDRLSYGIILLIFGVLFLLDKIGVFNTLTFGKQLLSIGSFFLIAGIVFVITQTKKVLGWVFLVIGLLLNADFLFNWMSSYSRYIIPILLIVAGFFLITGKKR